MLAKILDRLDERSTWAQIVTVVGTVLAFFNLDLPAGWQETVVNAGVAIGGAVAAIGVLIGVFTKDKSLFGRTKGLQN